MAGNEWINGYLEAILDTGASAIEEQKPTPANLSDRGHFNPTKYFVEEVVSGVDESDLHRTWLKVVATRNTRERSSRLENMCWRIWHLTRKKKQLEWEELQRLTKWRLERELGRMDVTEEMSEDLSEGEKGDAVGETVQNEAVQSETSKVPLQRTISNSEEEDKSERKLYIILISLHGLVRGDNMELGCDSDTGGQVKYVVELSRALAQMPGVYRVDLFTRQILSPEVDWSYGEPTEMLSAGTGDGEGDIGESSGAYIVRIPFGPRDKYLQKELLWPHIQEFVDGALAHVLNMSKALGDQIGGGQPVWPYVIHGHYADAGDSAALLSGALNVPMVLTGHSLGRNKLEQLLKQGRQSKEDINSNYKIMRRIEAEELSLDAAELVITSTKQEIEEQWGLYDGFDVKLEKVLRARARRGVVSHGRYMPRMVVIPPGMDFSNVVVTEDAPDDGELTLLSDGSSPKAIPTIWSDVMRFLTNPHKPMILALSRPDPKKNITTLLKAFGECRPLRELANLTLIMGNREDIDEMSAGNASVLTTVIKFIDKYDLYGQVAYPKHHKQSDVPDIYRLAAKTKGVFINPALVEPFGLTLIEAAAHGLPMVATKNGGPVDIHEALHNGLLVDPHDQQAISDALLKLLSEKNLWNDCRKNGLKNIHLFSWPAHCRTYMTRVAACRMRHPQWQTITPGDEISTEESFNDSLKDVQDMSLRLSVDGEKTSLNASVDVAASIDDPDLQDQVKRVLNKIKRSGNEQADAEKGNKMLENIPGKYPVLRRRRRLIVIALDCYDSNGAPEKKMIKILQEIIKAGNLDTQVARASGFALSTAMPLAETTEFLRSGKIQLNEFDALICSSGSEVYYPGSYEEDGKLYPDPDYATHIDYRWGCDGLRKTILKLLNASEDDSDKFRSPVQEDRTSSNAHCISYLIRNPSKAMKVDDLRQKLRMRGLRCHPMYCRTLTRMQIVPLLASRAQALRYLFVRWRLNLSNMYVFLGEEGDTDYEEMIAGTHKTIIMKGMTSKGSEDLLRTSGSYTRDDIVPPRAHTRAKMAAVATSNMDSLEKSLCDFSGAASLDQRFRSLFTIKGLAATSDEHMQRAIAIISAAFSDDSALLKHELAYVLGQLEDVRALPTLKRVLQDKSQDAMVRHEAAEAMGAISDPSVLPVLQEYLTDADVSVRETCELAISKINFDNSAEGKALKQAKAQAKQAEEQSGLGGVESAFKPIDPAPAMTPAASKEAAQAQADGVQYEATQVPLFRDTLLDTTLSLFERYRAMFALRNVAHAGGEGAVQAVLALAQGLKDGSALFRHEICFVFGELCHPASIPSMVEVLNDANEHEMVRHEAAEALGGIVEEGQEDSDAKNADFTLVMDTLKKWANDMEAPRVVRESCVVALDELAYNNDPTQFHRIETTASA